MFVPIRMRHVFRRRQASGQAASKKSPDQRPWHRRKKVGGVPAKTSASCSRRRKYPRRRKFWASSNHVAVFNRRPFAENHVCPQVRLHQPFPAVIQNQTDWENYAPRLRTVGAQKEQRGQTPHVQLRPRNIASDFHLCHCPRIGDGQSVSGGAKEATGYGDSCHPVERTV